MAELGLLLKPLLVIHVVRSPCKQGGLGERCGPWA